MTTTCDPWQTTFFFNIQSNFDTGSEDSPKSSVSVLLGKEVPSIETLKAAIATATAELTETLRSAIDTAIDRATASHKTPLLGTDDWKVVWGPQAFCVGPRQTVTFSDDGYTATFFATNAMYVVHSARLSRYIVAIAATNAASFYDWLVEDFDTSRVVAWEGTLDVWKDSAATATVAAAATAIAIAAAAKATAAAAVGTAAGAAAATAAIAIAAAAKATATTGAATAAAVAAANTGVPCISHATFTGISILQNIVDTVITQKTLVDFLKGLTPPDGTTVTFTGHSLAGALSPALAMACFDPDVGLLKGSAWSIGDAMVYPTAGATPGNQPFASLFNGAGWGGADDKGKRPWQVWNTDLYNNLDIVPHAWGAAMLDLIPGLYGVHYKAPKDMVEITGFIGVARLTAKKGEAIAGAYTPINKQALNPTGKAHAAAEFFDQYKVDGKDRYLTPQEALDTLPPQTSKVIIPWHQQAGLQHTIAYGSLLEIPKELLSD